MGAVGCPKPAFLHHMHSAYTYRLNPHGWPHLMTLTKLSVYFKEPAYEKLGSFEEKRLPHSARLYAEEDGAWWLQALVQQRIT